MVGAVGIAGLAGCLGEDDGGDDENPFTGGDGSDGEDATTGGSGAGDLEIGIADDVAFDGHPSVQNLSGTPYFGPAPGEAQGTVVAFEDPSCSRCASFEQGTVEQIRTELAAVGDATFVFRGYPVVYPWGDPASHVLEAVAARSAQAHFAMAQEYFTNQSDYSTDDVYDRSESRLADLTDLDAVTVVDEAREEAHAEAVDTDLAAGEAADATVTPSVYMFRDGEFQTKATGSIGFEAVRTTLGL
jgi:protein-disulfide isomerase